MNFNTPFSVQADQKISINSQTNVVFVADLFSDQYAGGAELTTDSLIQSCPFKSQKIMAKDVTIELLEQGHHAFWVFGNFSSMNLELIPTIAANMRYAILEYDYKYCRYRSPEKHEYAEHRKCNCEQEMHGKMISAFYFGSKNIFWMSEAQRNHYFEKFPFLQDGETYGNGPQNTVLSSVFDDRFFVTLNKIREKSKNNERKGWIVLGSNSWVKGFDQSEQWCKDNRKEYEVVWNLPYEELLEKLSVSEGFVYLPRGMDTCPRMVIEAKLLGCELVINDNVQHRYEEWFNTENLLEIEEYLYSCRDLFWSTVSSQIDYKPMISGYVTTKDCISQKYPWSDCIRSMLDFCDEVVVLDGGSSDGTWQELLKWSEEDSRVKVSQVSKDWSDSRFAVFDGELKAQARKLCRGDFCWQMDADEVVPEGSKEKIVNLCKNWPKMVELVSLPVIEYWGSKEKVRVDVNPWKWRISKNLPHITHGIPSELRKTDESGKIYALPGTDGCDYVHSETYERIPHASFYGEGAHNARYAALNGNKEALEAYQNWLKNCAELLPTVYHHSWLDISRKIKTYKGYWQKHWESLYDIKMEDTAENNMFFDKPWSEVTDEEIESLAKKLSEDTGGHIFHSKIDWNNPTPSVRI